MLKQVQFQKIIYKEKHSSIQLIKGPIARNSKGLALSSRNNYLSKENKVTACNIYAGLMNIQKSLDTGINNAETLKKTFSQT